MRARVRERDHPRFVPEQRRHARVVILKQLRDHLLLERALAEPVERILRPGQPRQRDAVDLHRVPVAREQHARLRISQAVAEVAAECRIGVDRRELRGARRLHAIERQQCHERIGLLQREVERQRLAVGVDVHLAPALDRLLAALEVLHRLPRRRLVVHRQHRHHEGRAAGLGDDVFEILRRRAGAGRDDEHAFPRML